MDGRAWRDTTTGMRRGPRRLIRPLQDFLHAESAGGVVLVVTTIVALVWANSPWQDSYHDLWSNRLAITLGHHAIDLDLRGWVNDGLMTLFFFVVGLEIKRELVEGELRDPRKASLPAVAALGGMVVPALLYTAINAGSDSAHGWGIPMATDIAMAVGVLSLLGNRVAPSLKLFLLALAIVDDIGAIVVIAIFYSKEIDFVALLVALALAGAVVALRALRVRPMTVYALLGAGVWFALHESGVHATLAGVALGLLAPTKPMVDAEAVDSETLADLSSVGAARVTATIARRSVSVVEWLESALHPWTSFVIVPLFALANAGIPLGSSALEAAATSRVTYGVAIGLVFGKIAGITLASWLAVRTRLGTLPAGTRWGDMVGVAAVAGIGFTVSIFVAGLAFDDATRQDEAKVGILAASVVAALLGTVLLARRSSTAPASPSTSPSSRSGHAPSRSA
jgi:NhaA family Na+:H+ antiporter